MIGRPRQLVEGNTGPRLAGGAGQHKSSLSAGRKRGSALRIGSIAAAFVWLTAATLAAAPGNESDFAFVSGMPAIEGVLSDTLENHDPLSGVAVRKQIYVYEHEGFELRTHVVEAACRALPAAGEPIIVALQYFPKDPKSFTIAAIPDLYLEVFARDEDGRIRAYQKVSGSQMVELTGRFLPVCRNV
jgi:hypothetical protein